MADIEVKLQEQLFKLNLIQLKGKPVYQERTQNADYRIEAGEMTLAVLHDIDPAYRRQIPNLLHKIIKGNHGGFIPCDSDNANITFDDWSLRRPRNDDGFEDDTPIWVVSVTFRFYMPNPEAMPYE